MCAYQPARKKTRKSLSLGEKLQFLDEVKKKVSGENQLYIFSFIQYFSRLP